MNIPIMTDPIYYKDSIMECAYYRRIGSWIEYTGDTPPKGIELVSNTVELGGGVMKRAQVIAWSTNEEFVDTTNYKTFKLIKDLIYARVKLKLIKILL